VTTTPAAMLPPASPHFASPHPTDGRTNQASQVELRFKGKAARQEE